MSRRREYGHLEIRCHLASGQFPLGIELEGFVNPCHPPTLRNRTDLGLLEVAWEEIDCLGWHADHRLPIALRRHGIEVHEPGSEDSGSHSLEHTIQAVVRCDLVI